MIIYKIIVGSLETNCYILADEKSKEAVIIDPGGEAEKILVLIKKENLKPEFIILTHAHPDHTGAVDDLKNKLKIEVLKVKEGDIVKAGKTEIEVIETPGHKEDGVCFVVARPAKGGEKEAVIFSGDTLFYRSIGRTDFEGGDFGQIRKSLNRLMEFPDNYKVFPGHGPETTIGEERKHNPFIRL